MPDEKDRWQVEWTAKERDPDATLADSEAGGSSRSALRLGPYAITREIGRGGQGVVYLAEDTRLGRQVALKVLSGVFGSDAWSRMRFEREAAATARLAHPGICTVFEAGTIDDTPFIAMRFVAGESFAARLARARIEGPPRTTSSLSAGRQRREGLFTDVEIIEKAARALHVAHEDGLVHRDIKPSNVIVEPSGQPVVLDFGLARDSRNADLLRTGTGAFLGTPPYMSPEQVDGTRTVDRRTDVWSLGVMLYECATGARPFEAPTIEGLLRAIRSVEPADPRASNAAVTPELAAVILRALEKEPARRYQDALALADDLGRARRLEPVEARTPSTAMRLRRWAQRNPVIAASISVVFLAITIALAVSLDALRTANAALSRERDALDEARDQRDRAEDLFSFMLVEMKGQLEGVGRLDLLGKVARKASDYFTDRPLDLDAAPESLQRALSLRNVGDVLKAEGDIAAAHASYAEAARIEEEIWNRDPANVAALKDLVSSLNALAGAAMARGDRTECVAIAERSLALRQTLVSIAPEDGDAKALLCAGMVMHANALRFADQPAAAAPAYEDAIARWEAVCAADSRPARRRELAVALQNLGEARRALKDMAGAIAARLRGLAIFESLARDEPQVREWQEQVATTHHGLALAMREQGSRDASIGHSEQAVAILRRLHAEDPTNTRRLYQLGTALYALGNIQEDAGALDTALEILTEAAGVRARLVALDPGNRSWRSDLGDAHRAVGVHLATRGELPRALEALAKASEVLRGATGERPDDVHAQGRLAVALEDEARILRELGQPADALSRTIAAVAAAEAAGGGPSPSRRSRVNLATRVEDAADAAWNLGDGATARRLQTRAIEIRRELAGQAADADSARDRALLGSALTTLGEWDAADGRLRDAAAALEEAGTLLSAARERSEDPAGVAVALVRARLAAAEVLEHLRESERSMAACAEAEAVFAAVPISARSRSDAAAVETRLDRIRRLAAILGGAAPACAADHEALARHLRATGRPGPAVFAFQKALAPDPSQRDAPLPALQLAIRTAADALAGADPADEARISAVALSWVGALAARLGALLDRLESRARDQAETGAIDDALRSEISTVRCMLATLCTHDPALAPLRRLPGFAGACVTASR